MAKASGANPNPLFSVWSMPAARIDGNAYKAVNESEENAPVPSTLLYDTPTKAGDVVVLQAR